MTSLHCARNQITDLAPLAGLSSLTSLHCAENQIKDLGPLAGLSSLTRLDCSENQITDLGPLAGLSSLTSLDCSDNQITDLGPVSGLSSLTSLDCSGNPITDLGPVAGLSSLTSLRFGRDEITDLGPACELESLESLTVHGSRIEEIPARLLALEYLRSLVLFETHVPSVPREILSQSYYDDCLERLRSHVADLRSGEEPVRDVKVIVIGNGRVGKTQLCRKLTDKPFDPTVASTHGITVAVHSAPELEGQPILNLWDFGGQDIYHGTHALFTRTRAVFIVVWNPASESTEEYEHEGLWFRNDRLPYWLQYVRRLGGTDCPLILIQSQCDRADQEVSTPPDQGLLEHFSFAHTRSCSAMENRGWASVKESLGEAIAYLRAKDGIASIGGGRAAVIRQLHEWRREDLGRPAEERTHRTLARADFDALCERTGGIQSPDALLSYLHQTGVVFHDEQYFGERVLLDQSWALEAVYALFDRRGAYRLLKDVRGRFSRRLLDSLVWGRYSPAQQALFLHLMEACGVCFKVRAGAEVPEDDHEYVAPDLLPERREIESELAQRQWDDAAPSVVVRFEFPFLHQGVIRQVISSIGSQALESGVYWRNGAWVFESRTRSAAVVEDEWDDDVRGRVVLRVQGGGREELARRLADLVRGRVEWSKPETTSVEIDGTLLDAQRASELLTRERERQLPAPTRAPSEKRSMGQDPDAEDREAGELGSAQRKELLEFAQAPSLARIGTPEVFVSYAWGDSSPAGVERQRVVDDLCRRLADRGIDVIRDRTHMQVGSRISDFMARIGRGGYVVVILSDKYIRSAFCMGELLQIYRNCAQSPDRFLRRVIPLILSDAEVDTLEGRIEHGLHWKRRFEMLKEKLDELGSERIGPSAHQEYRDVVGFNQEVVEMLTLVQDRLMPRDFDRMAEEGFREIVELISKGEGEDREIEPPR